MDVAAKKLQILKKKKMDSSGSFALRYVEFSGSEDVNNQQITAVALLCEKV